MATQTAIYTNQQNVENYLNRTLSDDEAAVFLTLENAVADIIDNYCARSFSLARAYAKTVDTTQGDGSSNPFEKFDGGITEYFFDQPLQTDTTQDSVFAPYIGYVDVDTGQWSLIDPKDYVFYPLNSSVKTSVMRNLGIFPYGLANNFIYGCFADYLTPPQGIVMASTIICADVINLPDGITREAIEGYSREFSQNWNPTIQKVLDIYRRVML
jgi:hypothetical protein